MTVIGKIETWNDDRGFGFIAPSAGGEDVFVHVSAIAAGGRRPTVGDVVRYAVGRDRKGRMQARDVEFVKGAAAAASKSVFGLDIRTALVAGFFALLFAVWLAGGFPGMILLIYAVMSAVAFAIYALDKKAAREDRWRIAESSMHVIALVGGWPGALLAQRTFRHKTRKARFQIVFRLTVLVNCGALAWLITNEDADLALAQFRALLG